MLNAGNAQMLQPTKPTLTIWASPNQPRKAAPVVLPINSGSTNNEIATSIGGLLSRRDHYVAPVASQ